MNTSSWASSAGVRKSMQSNRGKDTLPELALRRLLHSKGLRYRVNTRPLPDLRRTADVVFTRARLAVFVDGCFWHACPDHYTEPKRNVEYWRPKIARNVERDVEVNEQLVAQGWVVLRFWSHKDPVEMASDVLQALENS